MRKESTLNKIYFTRYNVIRIMVIEIIALIIILATAFFLLRDEYKYVLQALYASVFILSVSFLSSLFRGIYDKISFDKSGITKYRIFIKKHYEWYKVSNITVEPTCFKDIESYLITICINKKDKKSLRKIVIHNRGEILDDIRQYYSTKDKEDEQCS